MQERMDGDREGGISQIVFSKTVENEKEEVSEERRLLKERL